MKVFAVALLLAIVGIAIAAPKFNDDVHMSCDQDGYAACMDDNVPSCGSSGCVRYYDLYCATSNGCDF
jgi:hypothetical protein